MIDRVFPKLHNEGYKFLVIFGIITVILYFISSFLGLLGLVLTVWCYYFFRDPERQSINDDNYLVSPADGEVIKIEEVNGPKELNLESKKYTKISVFMKTLILVYFLLSKFNSFGPLTSSIFITSPSAGLTK